LYNPKGTFGCQHALDFAASLIEVATNQMRVVLEHLLADQVPHGLGMIRLVSPFGSDVVKVCIGRNQRKWQNRRVKLKLVRRDRRLRRSWARVHLSKHINLACAS
jgi:hypothetical protein